MAVKHKADTEIINVGIELENFAYHGHAEKAAKSDNGICQYKTHCRINNSYQFVVPLFFAFSI